MTPRNGKPMHLVAAADEARQVVLNEAAKAGYRVLALPSGGFIVEAGPFSSLDELLSHLNRPGFCLECGKPAELLCGVCVASHVTEPTGAADGAEAIRGSMARHPSAAPRRHLEVVT